MKGAFKDGGKGWNDIAGGATAINGAFKSVSPALKEFGNDLGNIFGDEVGEAISQAVDLAGAVGDVGEGVARIASGDVIGGVMSVVKGIGNIVSMGSEAEKRHQEALKAISYARIAAQREYNLLLLEQNLLYKEGKNAFGTDEIGRATNALRVYRDAVAGYKKELAGSTPTGGPFGTRTAFLFNTERRKAYDDGIGALYDSKIVTGHKKTGFLGLGRGKDTYSGILAVYPDLIDGENKLNVARAESILNTHKMDDSTRNLIQSLIDQQEQAAAALEELNAYIQETYGDIGDGIMNALVGSIQAGADTWGSFAKSGTEAWEEIRKSGAKSLEKLGQQLAYTLFLKNDFDKLQKDLETIYGSGKSEEEIAREAMNTVGRFYDTVGDNVDRAQQWMVNWKATAEKKGFDLWGNDENAQQSGKAGALQTISQDTGNKIDGMLTAVHMRVANMDDRGDQVMSLYAACDRWLEQISINTGNTATSTAALLAEMKKIIRDGLKVR